MFGYSSEAVANKEPFRLGKFPDFCRQVAVDSWEGHFILFWLADEILERFIHELEIFGL